MKVGILTQYYPPELGAPQRRLSALAERLAARGHAVTVLTAMPSYPTGRTFDGYGGVHAVETIGGVEVHRVPIFPTKSAAMATRLLNYGSFIASSSLMGPGCLGRLDVLITESPPLFLGISGVWLSRVTGARLVFNVSDLWPGSLVGLGYDEGSISVRMAYRLEAFCYRRSWLVTGQSKAIVADIARRFPDVPTYHFSNGVDTAAFDPARARDDLRARLRGGRPCSALYAGLHGIPQGLPHLVSAAARAGRDVQVTLLGDGPTKAALVASAGQSGVRFEDPRPADEMPSWVASADISVITLAGDILGAVPSKLYEAMASARPVVLMASGEGARMVERFGCGVVVSPGDVDGLARALRELAGDPDRRARLGDAGRAAAAAFDRDAIVAAFAEVLERG